MRPRSKLGAVLALPVGLAIVVLVWVLQPPGDRRSDIGSHPGVAPWDELGSATRGSIERDDTIVPTIAASSDESESTRELTTLSGFVLRRDSTPIPNAIIERTARLRGFGSRLPIDRSQTEDEPNTATVTSDRKGRFEFPDVRAGYYNLLVRATGYGRVTSRDAPTDRDDLTIFLEPEIVWKGEVVDTEGEGIPAARVRLEFLGLDSAELVRDARLIPFDGVETSADDEGKFELSGLSRGVYRARASAVGFAPKLLSVVAIEATGDGKPQSARFVLSVAVEIEGVVLSEDGSPIEGARVSALGTSRVDDVSEVWIHTRSGYVTLSDEDGRFRFESVEGGHFNIEATAEFHRGSSVDRVAAGSSDIELRLEKAQPIVVIVVDALNQEPISGATIHWSEDRLLERFSGVSIGKHSTRSDDAGEAHLNALPTDSSEVVVESRGYQSRAVELSSNRRQRVELEPAGGVSGIALDSSGSPIPGLRVSVVFPGKNLTEASSTTREDGSYHVEMSTSGTYQVVATGESFVPARSEVFELAEASSLVEGIDLRLESASELSGVVRSSEGLSVAGARIRVATVDQDDESTETHDSTAGSIPTPHAESRSDATGSYYVRRLSSGTYRAFVSAPGFVPSRSEEFALARGSPQTLNFVLVPEQSISGRVIDPDSEPIAGAEIHAILSGEHEGDPWTEGRAVTGHRGRFRVPRLGAGEFDLFVRADGFAEGEALGVSAGRRDIEIKLERLVSVSGRVIGWHSKEPITKFSLSVRSPGQDPPPPPKKSKDGGDSSHDWTEFRYTEGEFELPGIAPGEYLLDLYSASCLPIDPIEVEVLVDIGAQDLEIEVPERGVLSGVVLDGRTLPIAGVEVAPYRRWERSDGRRGISQVYGPRTREDIQAGRGPSLLSVHTGDDGRFVITGLEDGEYRLDFQHDEFERKDIGDFLIVDGEGGDAALAISTSLSWGVTLRGRVWGLKEVEGQRARMKLRPLKVETSGEIEHRQRSKSLEVTGLGEFEFPALSAGTYLLYLEYRRPNEERSKTRRELVRIFDEGREKVIRLDLSKRASRRDR